MWILTKLTRAMPWKNIPFLQFLEVASNAHEFSPKIVRSNVPTKKTSLTCQSEAADILSEYGNLRRGDRKRSGVKHRTQDRRKKERNKYIPLPHVKDEYVLRLYFNYKNPTSRNLFPWDLKNTTFLLYSFNLNFPFESTLFWYKSCAIGFQFTLTILQKFSSCYHHCHIPRQFPALK